MLKSQQQPTVSSQRIKVLYSKLSSAGGGIKNPIFDALYLQHSSEKKVNCSLSYGIKQSNA